MRENVYHPLDDVHRLSDPEGAAVGDTALRLVGVSRIHLAESILQVVRPSDNAEQSHRKLRGIGVAMEISVIANSLDLNGNDGSVLCRCNLASHVKIPAEGCGRLVIGAIVNPLYRMPGRIDPTAATM